MVKILPIRAFANKFRLLKTSFNLPPDFCKSCKRKLN